MWTKWLPWRTILKHAAKRHGFLDPLTVFSHISRFSQPAEVVAPIELIRAGVVLHARGLINSQAIQHNLDWIWPYWINCQFDPRNDSFVPRAFSLTHINLTHRNWTAVGLPDSDKLPIVDPKGLVTPFWDSWSIDAWVLQANGKALFPSMAKNAEQELSMGNGLSVLTQSQREHIQLCSRVEVIQTETTPFCRIRLNGTSDSPGWLVVSLRPYNPEGISFIHEIDLSQGNTGWTVNKRHPVFFSENAAANIFSSYKQGDVSRRLLNGQFKKTEHHINCNIGMATSAAFFEIGPDGQKEIDITIPLKEETRSFFRSSERQTKESWDKALKDTCSLDIPDKKMEFLFKAALRTLVLHSSGTVYAGPYTYKRFWFRDAVLILQAMLCVGLTERSIKIIEDFPLKQNPMGYFHSQDGEWDSNGQVLWLLQKLRFLTNKDLPVRWHKVIKDAAQWIIKKRTRINKDHLHSGLMAAGFSAEHLGPNDYFYWDDFWSIAGLNAAGFFMEIEGKDVLARKFRSQAADLMKSVQISLEKVSQKIDSIALPSSPYRRLDSGSIGSLAAGYPLQLWPARDERLTSTISYLLNNCMVDNGFFHDMSHSGINPYLTLHMAQVMLRADDRRYFDLVKAISSLASATGQWPEAIHPKTKGGCMGDGQHVWAAAEWIMIIRNMFVREEGDRLILCAGIPQDWLIPDNEIKFGPAATAFGPVSVKINTFQNKIIGEYKGNWHTDKPQIDIRLFGYKQKETSEGKNHFEFVKA